MIPASMNPAKREIAGAAALIAAATGLLLTTPRFPPDARVFPRLVLGALVVAAIAWAIRGVTMLRKNEPAAAEPAAGNVQQLLAAALVTLGYGVSVSLWSYFVPTLLYIPIMAFVLGNRKALITIPTAALYVVTIYLLFVVLFERPVPLL